MQIIDGYVGAPNIYADVIGEHNISMYGPGDYVLNVGECLGYELISNNEIRIKDGMFITQGRRGYIKKGTTEVCQIDNGAQTGKRNDLIVIEYAKDLSTQVESHTIKVLKGIPGAEASDPEITTGSIPDRAILHQMPLYRVKIEGLNVAAVEQMFSMGSVAAETVNPMLTTELGFAADAKLTGDALYEINENLAGVRFGFTEEGKPGVIITDEGGADSVLPFIDTSDATATASMITEGFTAYVNGKLVVGTRPLPVGSLTGSFFVNRLNDGDNYTCNVTFETPFDEVPKVSASSNFQWHNGECTVWTPSSVDYFYTSVSNVSRTGCTITLQCRPHYNLHAHHITCTWRATTG